MFLILIQYSGIQIPTYLFPITIKPHPPNQIHTQIHSTPSVSLPLYYSFLFLPSTFSLLLILQSITISICSSYLVHLIIYLKPFLTLYLFFTEFYSQLQQMSDQWQTCTHGRIHEIKHRKKWELSQTLKYYHYVILNKNTLQVADRNKKHQVYNRMAKCIGSRNTHQCRSHHQKIVKRFGSIHQFCQNFKLKHPHLFESSSKSHSLDDSFSDSNKPLSLKSQEKIKNQQLSSRNIESLGQSSSIPDSESNKEGEDKKYQNSEQLGEKQGKQCFSKNTHNNGTKNQQEVEATQKTKKQRRRRRISYRPHEVQRNEYPQPNKQYVATLTPNLHQNFPPPHPFPFPNHFIPSWNDMPIPPFPSPLLIYQQELRKMTENHLNRIPQHEKLNMIDEGINYLMSLRNDMRRFFDPRKDIPVYRPYEPVQKPETSYFHSYLAPRQMSEQERWEMVQEQKKLDQEGTGTSSRRDDDHSDQAWQGSKPHEEQLISMRQKQNFPPYQLQPNYTFLQSRQSQHPMAYHGMNAII